MSGLCHHVIENMSGHTHVKVQRLSYLSLWRWLARAGTAPGTANTKHLLSSSSSSSKALIVKERHPSLEQCSWVWHHCSRSPSFHLSCFCSLIFCFFFSFLDYLFTVTFTNPPSTQVPFLPCLYASTSLPLWNHVCVPCCEGLFIIVVKSSGRPRHLASTIWDDNYWGVCMR